METPENFSIELVKEALYNIFHAPKRRIKMYTGAVGLDRFDELVENDMGYYRIYLGKKVPGIISRITKMSINKSMSGRYYKRFRHESSTEQI